MLGFQGDAEFDRPVLRAFLQENVSNIDVEPYLSQFRKLVCRFDRLEYGF